MEATQAAFNKAAAYNVRVETATAKLNAELAASEHQAELAKLRDLIALNEALKLQEAQFKASCSRQRNALRVRRACPWVIVCGCVVGFFGPEAPLACCGRCGARHASWRHGCTRFFVVLRVWGAVRKWTRR